MLRHAASAAHFLARPRAGRLSARSGAQIVRRHAMKGHLLSKKSPKRKRFLGGEAVVERCDINNARDCLPYAGVKG